MFFECPGFVTLDAEFWARGLWAEARFSRYAQWVQRGRPLPDLWIWLGGRL